MLNLTVSAQNNGTREGPASPQQKGLYIKLLRLMWVINSRYELNADLFSFYRKREIQYCSLSFTRKYVERQLVITDLLPRYIVVGLKVIKQSK